MQYHKQEGQEALNRSPDFSLKLTYRYLLKAGHVPGDTWGGINLCTRGIIWTNLVKVYYVMLHTKYQTLGIMVSDKNIFSMFP